MSEEEGHPEYSPESPPPVTRASPGPDVSGGESEASENSVSAQVDVSEPTASTDAEPKASEDETAKPEKPSNSDDDEYDPEAVYDGEEEFLKTFADQAAEEPKQSETEEKEAKEEANVTNTDAEGSPEAKSEEREIAGDSEEQHESQESDEPEKSADLDPQPETSSLPTSADGIDVDVPLFNDVIKYFLQSPLFSDPNFQNLPPREKEQMVISGYNQANGTNVQVRLNFAATTSYNKPQLRPGETFQVLVPINPFCLRPDISQPMSFKERNAYEQYLRDEDSALSSGKWDNFPIGSRLFIGNLAVNTLTKEDVYRIFHPYGEIKQVNIKQGYGFVQYSKAEECSKAIEGEKNVPLHNRFMHLQVSKHQIQRAMEQQGKNSLPSKNSRGRSRSPEGRNKPTRSRSPINETEVKVITSLDSTPEFNNKLLKRLKQDGLSLETEHFDLPGSDVPQEAITSAAYNGILAVVITRRDKLDVMIYEKTSDGGIRFDEYTEISIGEAVELILAAKGKRFASGSREVQSRGRSRQNNNQNRQTKNGNQALYGSRGGRQQHQQGSGSGKHNNSRYNNSPSPYPTAYATGSNAQPFIPRPGYPSVTPPPPVQYGMPPNVGFAPSYPGFQQQMYPNVSVPQASLPQVPPNQNQLLQTMQSMDPSTLQNVLSLMQQMQQPTGSAPQQPPMQQGNALSGLLGQLQNSAPGNSPPAPSYSGASNQFSQPSNSNSAGSSNSNNQDQTNDLFETLARLKNNM